LEYPIGVLNQFFQKFSIDYIRRELCDFLEAGISHGGSKPNDFTPWRAWMTYNHLQCLTEAAYQTIPQPSNAIRDGSIIHSPELTEADLHAEAIK
jgi:hypothetical protein